MLELNLPKYSFKIRESEGKKMIFDRCRKKYVTLTPEEWVRQHLVEFLVSEKNYPASLVVNEAAVEVNRTRKRCDTVVYNKNGLPGIDRQRCPKRENLRCGEQNKPLQPGGHILRKIPGIRARVGDQPLFVERLRDIENRSATSVRLKPPSRS